MRIFLSWSGRRSLAMAEALREWLPLVLYFAEPWLSKRDISAGKRWSLEIGRQLEVSQFGIICLTKTNVASSWVLFEAGALAKSLASGVVCPYILDLKLGEIGGPLAQLQAKKADKKSTLELVHSINSESDQPIANEKVEVLFESLWPKLSDNLKRIPLQEEQAPARAQEEILEDLVRNTRNIDQRLRIIEDGIIGAAPKEGVSSIPQFVVQVSKYLTGGGRSTGKMIQFEGRPADFFKSVAGRIRLSQEELKAQLLHTRPKLFLRDVALSHVLSHDELTDLQAYFGDRRSITLELTGMRAPGIIPSEDDESNT